MGYFSSPVLADIDGDGDLDALIGAGVGNTIFFANTGSSTAPAFAASSANPFGLADVGYFSSPVLADIDGDGDLDALIGEEGGRTFFFENVASTPTPGTCPASPLSGCDTPLKSLLLIKDNNSDDRDLFKLKLIKNSPVRQGSALGDPTADAIYTACVWEGGSLIAQAKAPAGANWSAVSDKGYKYKDQTASSDGIKLVKVLAGPTTGNAKETKVIVIGKGTNLPDPAVPVSAPVNITAQVIDSKTGLCFGDTFGDATVKKNAANASNTVRIFKAKKP